MNKFYFLVCVASILLSCSGSQGKKGINEDTPFYSWNYSKEPLSSLFDRIEYLPLDDHPDALFKKADKLIIYDDKYFIFDMFGQNQVKVFSQEGIYLYPIGIHGNGPGEYVGIRNFAVKDGLIYLMDNYTGRLLVHDADNGEFIEERSLPFYAHDMAIAENGDFIFAQQQLEGVSLMPDQQFNVFITNADLEVKYRLFPLHEEPYKTFAQAFYFTESSESIIFHTMVADSIILFDRTSPSDHYSIHYIDFGSKAVPLKYRGNYEEIHGFTYLVNTPFITPKYMIGRFSWAEYGDYPYIYLYDKEQALFENDNNSVFLFDPLFYKNDTIYSLYNHDYFLIWERENSLPQLPDKIIEHLQEGNDVLVKYVLK